MSEPSARGAVRLLGGVELRRSFVAIVLLGVCSGLIGGVIAGSIGLARRTSSAFDRLAVETQAEDARVNVFTEQPAALEDVASLPGVAAARLVGIGVGRLEQGTEVTYVGMISAAPSETELYRPIVKEGRMPSADAPDEAVITERLVDQLGVGVGDHLPVTMLTREETAQFDTGFGDPDGPFVDLVITGIVRVLPGVMDSSPVLTSPAFAATYGETALAGEIIMITVDDASSRDELVAGVAALNSGAAQAEGRTEFLGYDIQFVDVARRQYAGAARVLVVGLVLFAGIAALAGTFAVGQALLRRAGVNAESQRIESALGLDVRDRIAIRVLPMLPAAVVAAAVTVVVGVVAGTLEPPGSVAGIEPHPGLLVDWLPIVVVAAGTAVVLVALTAVAAWSAGRPERADRAAGPAATRLVSGVGSPAVAASAAFALAAGRGRTALPARTAIISTVIGVAGLVGALTFATSLSSLHERPESWGWPGPFTVVDVNPEIETVILDDPRVAAMGVVASSSGVIDGQDATLSSVTNHKGPVDWTVIEGRAPADAGEIGLGTRLSERLGVGIGDQVVVTAPDGVETPLRVVSIMLLPPFDSSPLGDGAVVTPEAQAALAQSDPLREGVVIPAAGIDPDELMGEYATRWEVFPALAPPEVEHLFGLGSLPELLGLFVALVGTIAMANAVVIAIRRHARELVVLRAIGFTGGQVGGVIVGMALTTAIVGVALGVPLGLALGRFVWWAAAADAGLGTSIDVPLGAIVSISAAVAIVAALIGVVPGVRGSRQRNLAELRAE